MPPYDDWNNSDDYVPDSDGLQPSQAEFEDMHCFYNYQQEHEEDDYFIPFRPDGRALSPHLSIKKDMNEIEISDYKDGVLTMVETALKQEFEDIAPSTIPKYSKKNPPVFQKSLANQSKTYQQLRAGYRATQIEMTMRLFRAMLNHKRKRLIKYTKGPRLFEYSFLDQKALNGTKIKIALSPIRAGVRRRHLAQEIRLLEMMLRRQKAYMLGLLSISLGVGKSDNNIRRHSAIERDSAFF